MKTLTTAAFAAVLLTAIASPSQAQNIVTWGKITGIAQAKNVVGGIAGAGQPWSTREGGGVFVELANSSVPESGECRLKPLDVLDQVLV